MIDAVCNELGITVPVAVHADHYGIQNDKDLATAKIEIPSMFDAGITSIAIDASHLPDDRNLLASIELNPLIPKWAGLETEVGEIKGKEGLSTPEEALFLIQGLNAHDIFPDWIALNNGTTHGIEESDAGHPGRPDRRASTRRSRSTRSPARSTAPPGNSSDRLRQIAQKTNTTKANVATALQMISWGLEVNDYGNAIMDANKNFKKVPGAGVTEEMWEEMVKYAAEKIAEGRGLQEAEPPLREQARRPSPRRPRPDGETRRGLRVRHDDGRAQLEGHGAARDRGDSQGQIVRPGAQGEAHGKPGGLDRRKRSWRRRKSSRKRLTRQARTTAINAYSEALTPGDLAERVRALTPARDRRAGSRRFRENIL